MRKDGRADRWTDMTKLIVAFRNFANAHTNNSYNKIPLQGCSNSFCLTCTLIIKTCSFFISCTLIIKTCFFFAVVKLYLEIYKAKIISRSPRLRMGGAVSLLPHMPFWHARTERQFHVNVALQKRIFETMKIQIFCDMTSCKR